jgi:hypothetical protein
MVTAIGPFPVCQNACCPGLSWVVSGQARQSEYFPSIHFIQMNTSENSLVEFLFAANFKKFSRSADTPPHNNKSQVIIYTVDSKSRTLHWLQLVFKRRVFEVISSHSSNSTDVNTQQRQRGRSVSTKKISHDAYSNLQLHRTKDSATYDLTTRACQRRL